MKGLIYLIKKLWTFLISIRTFIPKSMVGIFIVSNFISNTVDHGIVDALKILASNLLSAEITIRDNVNMALRNDPNYGFYELFGIFTSVLIIYLMIKFWGNLLRDFSGSQATKMAYLFGAFIVFLIEYGAVATIYKDFSFIPLWHGIIFLFLNIEPVLTNIHFLGISFNPDYNATVTEKPVAIEKIENYTQNMPVNITEEFNNS